MREMIPLENPHSAQETPEPAPQEESIVSRIRNELETNPGYKFHGTKDKWGTSAILALYFFSGMEGALAVSKEEKELEQRAEAAELFEQKMTWSKEGRVTPDDMRPEDYTHTFYILPVKLQVKLLDAMQKVEIRDGTPQEITGNPSRFNDAKREQNTGKDVAHTKNFGAPNLQYISIFTQGKEYLPYFEERQVFYHELGHILHGSGNVSKITENWKTVMQKAQSEISEYTARLVDADDKSREDYAETFAELFSSPMALAERDKIRFDAMRAHIREVIENPEWDPRNDWVEQNIYFEYSTEKPHHESFAPMQSVKEIPQIIEDEY